MSRGAVLLVGTRKGAFILDGDAARRSWSIRGPFCEGFSIHDVSLDPSDGAILAGGGSPWFGPAVWRSGDLGATWTHSSAGLTYGDAGPDLTRVWNVTAAAGALYAGVEPAGLFRSDDGGRTWTQLEGLRAHPSRPDWQPGNGGLICHTIVADPADPAHLWVGISAVGVFETRDGGATWNTRNTGVRADFVPGPAPEFGQCVHKLAKAAGEPATLYQQNHCGVYRSDDAGSTWTEITAGLPVRFRLPDRRPPARSRDRLGDAAQRRRQGALRSGREAGRLADARSWSELGAPGPRPAPRDAYISVLREAMAVDDLEPAGVYIGTSTGEIYGSADEGETWSTIATHLPPIASVDVAIVDR